MINDRKKDVINICLDHFIDNGLSDTSTRGLSSALKLQNAGLYYYFTSKDEAVIACAEEAALRLEQALIMPAIKELKDPDRMMEQLQVRADEMVPTMRFLVSVCSNKRYIQSVKPVLDRLAERFDHYTDKIAKNLKCQKLEIEPYVYMIITAVANYMIFAEDSVIAPQMDIAKTAIKRIADLSAQ